MRRALLPVVLAALLLAPGASAWTWPAGGPVLQPFLFDPSHPYAAGQHRGIDLGGAEGSPVLAPAAGTVSFAGTVPSSGKSVTIETPDGYSVTLTHLGSISVARNAEVAEGGPVGTIGASGDGEVPQPYVHLGVRLTEQVQGYLDPLTLLPPHGAAPAEPAPVPTPAPVSSVGARTRPGSTAGPNGRRGRAFGHAVARAGRFVRPNAGPSNRFAACNRGGGVGRGTYRAGSGTRGPARGGRRAGARGHGGDAHCAAARCSAGRCSAGGCGARPDERDERDTPSRAVAAPRPRRQPARARSRHARATPVPRLAHRGRSLAREEYV